MRASAWAILRDRRRAQRGSVLSGVLIMVAFLAILSGALLTALSTNFILAARLVDHVNDEATVGSAMELAYNSLQGTQGALMFNGCPALGSVPLNGLKGVADYASCVPVLDRAQPQTLSGIASGGQFLQDGTSYSLVGGAYLYVNGDSKGNLVALLNAAEQWSVGLGGEIVGTPRVMADPSAPPDGVSYVVPITNPRNGQSLGCSTNCVALLSGDGASMPSLTCLMPAGSPVSSQAGAGLAEPGLAYFGDSSGDLYAYSAMSGRPTPCDLEGSASISSDLKAGVSVVAGPFVVGSAVMKATDDLFAVVANGSAGNLVHYTYTSSKAGFTYAGSLALPGVPVGAAMQGSLVAITFANNDVSLVQTNSMSIVGTIPMAGSITDSPSWSTTGSIGVAAGNTLSVLDTNLNVLASSTAPGSITTAPASDLGGDWFVATTGGQLYVRPGVGGSAQMVPLTSMPVGSITSAPIATPCMTGICVYMGSSDTNVYYAGLDARDATLDACITACATGNFSLRSEVEVGAMNSPRTVHVEGWSYYSP